MIIKDSESIYVDINYKHIYTRICPSQIGKGETKKDDIVFERMADLFTFAAYWGFLKGKRMPLEGKDSPFKWQVLTNQQQKLLEICVLQATSKGLDLARDSKSMRELIEEHANAGIMYFSKQLNELEYDFTDLPSLISFLYDEFINSKP